MFFFFVGCVEQGTGRVLKGGGGAADLVETEKVLKLFVPMWRWPGKDPAYLCCECGLLAPGSLGGEPGPLLPRDPQFRFCAFCGFAL